MLLAVLGCWPAGRLTRARTSLCEVCSGRGRLSCVPATREPVQSPQGPQLLVPSGMSPAALAPRGEGWTRPSGSPSTVLTLFATRSTPLQPRPATSWCSTLLWRLGDFRYRGAKCFCPPAFLEAQKGAGTERVTPSPRPPRGSALSQRPA
jgi:hypothetical protein